MSKTASPHRFDDGMDHYYDPNFTADISHKMRVPKRIKVGGGGDDDVTAYTGLTSEKFEMHVPDRILVVGQEQHVGTKAPPRELILENSIMPPDPGLIRVQTPPRVITLDEYSFPSADDAPTVIPDAEEKFVSTPQMRPKFQHDNRLIARGETPPIGAGGEGLTPAEELMHLRKQMAKLNRRMMAVELDNLQRQQRDKFLCALGLAYFFLKTVLWLSRS